MEDTNSQYLNLCFECGNLGTCRWYGHVKYKHVFICNSCYYWLKKQLKNIKRVCYECLSDDTAKGSRGGKIWFKLNNNYVCAACFRKGKRNIFYGRRGKMAPNWRGGVTALHEHIRTLVKYKEWRSACMKRDGYKCVDCGYSKGRCLEVNHIIRYSDILREYNIKSIEDALKCEKLWDISNGETLCKTCHIRKTHNYI